MIEIHPVILIILILISHTIGYFVAVSSDFTERMQELPSKLFNDNVRLKDKIEDQKEIIYDQQEEITRLKHILNEYKTKLDIENI